MQSKFPAESETLAVRDLSLFSFSEEYAIETRIEILITSNK